jgi:hypothetical protein
MISGETQRRTGPFETFDKSRSSAGSQAWAVFDFSHVPRLSTLAPTGRTAAFDFISA